MEYFIACAALSQFTIDDMQCVQGYTHTLSIDKLLLSIVYRWMFFYTVRFTSVCMCVHYNCNKLVSNRVIYNSFKVLYQKN